MFSPGRIGIDPKGARCSDYSSTGLPALPGSPEGAAPGRRGKTLPKGWIPAGSPRWTTGAPPPLPKGSRWRPPPGAAADVPPIPVGQQTSAQGQQMCSAGKARHGLVCRRLQGTWRILRQLLGQKLNHPNAGDGGRPPFWPPPRWHKEWRSSRGGCHRRTG